MVNAFNYLLATIASCEITRESVVSFSERLKDIEGGEQMECAKNCDVFKRVV